MGIKKPGLNKGKRVTVAEPIPRGPEVTHPVFCFRYIDPNFDLTQCDKDEQAAFISQLRCLSQLDWNVIVTTQRHGMGTEKISRGSISGRIPACVTDDVNDFLAFRFQAKKPFVGIRRNQVFHVLWIDAKFALYKHS